MCKALIIPAAVAAVLTLAGCASMPGSNPFGFGYSGSNTRAYPNSANVYTPGESQQVAEVRTGVVIAVQPVEIQTGNGRKLAGETIGGLAGGLLGHTVGGGNGKTLATVAGALGGAVAGDAVASHHYAQRGLQITVALDHHGGDIAVTQQIGPTFAVGERVEIIGAGYGNQPARVQPLPAY